MGALIDRLWPGGNFLCCTDFEPMPSSRPAAIQAPLTASARQHLPEPSARLAIRANHRINALTTEALTGHPPLLQPAPGDLFRAPMLGQARTDLGFALRGAPALAAGHLAERCRLLLRLGGRISALGIERSAAPQLAADRALGASQLPSNRAGAASLLAQQFKLCSLFAGKVFVVFQGSRRFCRRLS